MLNRRLLLRIGVFFCIALFGAGIIRLFWLRFEAGDLYPPYSSLRSDPLGVQVLYESLEDLGRQALSRNFSPPGQLELTPGSTFLVYGLTSIPSVSDGPWKTLLEKATAGGGRLVVSISSKSRAGTEEKTDAKEAAAKNEKASGEDAAEEKTPEAPTLGVNLRRRPLDEGRGDLAVREEFREAGGLPEALVFRSPLFFVLDDPAWETIYSFEDEAVVIRRAWGEGEVVMIADSYLFSNEALRSHRFPAFLAWITRSGGLVVFDEYHHGLTRQPGISTLMRKYRLQGVMLSLAVVVALLIWQQAVVFAPRPAGDDDGRDAAPGAEAASGWVGLMRRHIAPGDLLAVCLEAWESSTAADRFSEEQIGQVRESITRVEKPPRHRDPVAVYKSICELLKRGNTP